MRWCAAMLGQAAHQHCSHIVGSMKLYKMVFHVYICILYQYINKTWLFTWYSHSTYGSYLNISWRMIFEMLITEGHNMFNYMLIQRTLAVRLPSAFGPNVIFCCNPGIYKNHEWHTMELSSIFRAEKTPAIHRDKSKSISNSVLQNALESILLIMLFIKPFLNLLSSVHICNTILEY